MQAISVYTEEKKMPALPYAAAAAALAATLFSPAASAACYYIYAADSELIYRSYEAPVDLSFPLHQTLSSVAPGGKMVFTLDTQGCEVVINKLPSRTKAAVGAAPRARRADRG
jgi:hypothetical protein